MFSYKIVLTGMNKGINIYVFVVNMQFTLKGLIAKQLIVWTGAQSKTVDYCTT